MRVLVAGASGNVGRALVDTLLHDGHDVVAVVRRPDVDLPAGAVPVVADLQEPASLNLDQARCEAAFLEPGYNNMAALVARVCEAGAHRVVALSGLSAASGDRDNAVTAMMMGSEEAVTSGPAGWTILRPAAFMSNCLRWAGQLADGDDVTLPFANVRSAMTHPADIAAVAAIALTTTDHDGRVYPLSGPEALTPAQQVDTVGRVLNRGLRLVAQSGDDAWAELTASMPREMAEAFFDFYVAGSLDESVVHPTVEQVTGRPPKSLQDWAQENRARFPAVT